jgi:salicylate hydroxylase
MLVITPRTLALGSGAHSIETGPIRSRPGTAPAVQKQLPILIAGGGLGGLCAAFALSCRGCSVRVLERADEIKEIGAGIQLGPNVFRILDRLGIADRVLVRAVFPARHVLMDSISGQPLTSNDVQDDFRQRFEYP